MKNRMEEIGGMPEIKRRSGTLRMALGIMGKSKISIIILLVLVIIVYLIQPNYKFDYFNSKCNSYMITKIKRSFLGHNKFYFFIGYYNKNRIPDSYILDTHAGREIGYDITFYKIGDTLFFNSNFCLIKDLPTKVKQKNIDNIQSIGMKQAENIELLNIVGSPDD